MLETSSLEKMIDITKFHFHVEIVNPALLPKVKLEVLNISQIRSQAFLVALLPSLMANTILLHQTGFPHLIKQLSLLLIKDYVRMYRTTISPMTTSEFVILKNMDQIMIGHIITSWYMDIVPQICVHGEYLKKDINYIVQPNLKNFGRSDSWKSEKLLKHLPLMWQVISSKIK